MIVHFHAENRQPFSLVLDSSVKLDDVTALLEAETGIAVSDQRLFLNDRQLTDYSLSLHDAGVSENSRLDVRSSNPSALSTQSANPLEDVERHRLQLLANEQALDVARQMFPELAEAAISGDTKRFAELLPDIQARHDAAALEKQRNIELLHADPFDVNAQMQIEEAIRQERVMENMAHAVEFSPESFGVVNMLYVNVEVNGVPLKAFVDSGAQRTIMSPETAEKCGIMRLIDHRFASIARGVGTAKVLGRVHSAQLKVGDLHLACSFTILEGKNIDILFGLDMLKRHQACIDLAQNALVIQDRKIPFLPEHEIPKTMEEMDEKELQEALSGNSNNTNPTTGKAAETSNKMTSRFQGQGNVLGGSSSSSLNTAPTSSSSSSAAAAAPSRTTGAGNKYPSSVIDSLTGLGVPAELAIQLLDATGGDPDRAASLYFSQLP